MLLWITSIWLNAGNARAVPHHYPSMPAQFIFLLMTCCAVTHVLVFGLQQDALACLG